MWCTSPDRSEAEDRGGKEGKIKWTLSWQSDRDNWELNECLGGILIQYFLRMFLIYDFIKTFLYRKSETTFMSSHSFNRKTAVFE